MKSRVNTQLNLGPVELRGSEQSSAAFRKSEQAADAAPAPSESLAAELLDAAFDAAHLTNKEIAHLCGVSVSLVEKWRSSEARGCPSFVQMLLLPPSFHIALHRVMNRRFGYGRVVLKRVLDDISDLALAMEA